MKDHVRKFFKHLEIYEDIQNRKNYKDAILASIILFLDAQDVESARNVYDNFFKAYWVGIQHKENPFIALTNILRKYEENAGRVIERQRDHYVHSVYVFILGLTIYVNNEHVQNIFNEYALNKSNYPDSYDTKNEEFFYRWGLAALFHDIAYPLEITVKQANRYLDVIWGYPDKTSGYKKIYMEMPDFKEFIRLPTLKPDRKYFKEYYLKYPFFKDGFKGDVVDLLSEMIAKNFHIPLTKLKRYMKRFVNDMKQQAFIDHGFYSSVIMARWHYYLIKMTNWNPAYFYFPVIDSASAILLHNFYRLVLMKEPFCLNKMRIDKHPIAFLLILCDELQEWCRKGYGESDADMVNPDGVIVNVNCDEMEISYIFRDVCLPDDDMLKKKKESILKILCCDNLFKKGIVLKQGG